MLGEGDRFLLPRRQTEKRADSQSAKAGGVCALSAIKAPGEIAFRTRSMHRRINHAVVGFLINNKALPASLD